MNKVILIGNLANDPESRTTASGIAQCSFRLAVTRRFANQQGVREADFFPIICWRQTAEVCARYLSKGRKVAVEGSIQTRSYDAQDGTKRYVTEIIAENVEFLGSRSDGAHSGGFDAPDGYAPAPKPQASDPYAPASRPAPKYAAKTQPPQGGESKDIDDDELPF